MSHATLLATLKSMTTVTALAVRLSPLPDIWRIHKTKSTENVSVVPFVALFGTNYLWWVRCYASASLYKSLPLTVPSLWTGCSMATWTPTTTRS